LSLLMASVMCLHFSMQEEDILEHTKSKCDFYILKSTCRPLRNISIHLQNIITRTCAKILVCALECQV
jgi:hypothetical protein